MPSSDFGLIQISQQYRIPFRWESWKIPSGSNEWNFENDHFRPLLCYSFCFSLPTLAPCPLVQTFNQIPIAVQVWILVQSFFTSISLYIFCFVFYFFPLFWLFKYHSDLVVSFAMVAQWYQLSIAVQIWNFVQSFFISISRTFFLQFFPLFGLNKNHSG